MSKRILAIGVVGFCTWYGAFMAADSFLASSVPGLLVGATVGFLCGVAIFMAVRRMVPDKELSGRGRRVRAVIGVVVCTLGGAFLAMPWTSVQGVAAGASVGFLFGIAIVRAESRARRRRHTDRHQ